MEKAIDLDVNKHFGNVMGQFDVFRQNNQHCEFVVKTGSEEISVHRNVLAACSAYFNAMLSHDTLEKQSGVVVIKDVDEVCVKKCIDYVYTGKASVSEDKYQQLMHVAHMFQLQELCDGIAVFLEDNLDSKSFFVAKRLANTYNCKKLEEKCDQFALKNLAAISEIDEFKQLDEEYFKFLIKNKDASGELRCRMTIIWANFDQKNRSRIFMEVLKTLDLQAISVEYRGHLTQEERLVYNNPEVSRIFSKSLLDTIQATTRPSHVKRKTSSTLVVFDKTSRHLQQFNVDEKSWTHMHEIHQDVLGTLFSAIGLGDQIYVIMENKTVFQLRYSEVNAVWVRMEDMNYNHGHCPPVTVHEGYIYVVGGNNVETDSVEKYDPLSNKWVKIENKSIQCSYSSATASRDVIYSIGGRTAGVYHNDVERFVISESNWTPVAPMHQARCNSAAIAWNDKIYVLGGVGTQGDSSDVECFGPVSNTWTLLPPLNMKRQLHTAVVLDGKMYVVGGTAVKSIETYDPSEQNCEIFTTWKDMNVFSRGCVVVQTEAV